MNSQGGSLGSFMHPPCLRAMFPEAGWKYKREEDIGETLDKNRQEQTWTYKNWQELTRTDNNRPERTRKEQSLPWGIQYVPCTDFLCCTDFCAQKSAQKSVHFSRFLPPKNIILLIFFNLLQHNNIYNYCTSFYQFFASGFVHTAILAAQGTCLKVIWKYMYLLKGENIHNKNQEKKS